MRSYCLPIATCLANPRLLTDATRNIAFSDGYQTCCQDNRTAASLEAYKFTGKPVSQTTGLYYEYRRWYDSSTGRFISADPAPGQLTNPQTLNRYVYAVDRPTSIVDPTGWTAATHGTGTLGVDVLTMFRRPLTAWSFNLLRILSTTTSSSLS
jgi:RHS repeat-associated protein